MNSILDSSEIENHNDNNFSPTEIDAKKSLLDSIPTKPFKQLDIAQSQVDKLSSTISKEIYKKLNEIEVKLVILSVQHQEISVRSKNIKRALSDPKLTLAQDIFSKLPSYFRKLEKMKVKIARTEEKVKEFAKRQAGLIKNRHRIIALKQWKEGELNSRLQAEESSAQVRNIKLKNIRSIQFESCDLPEKGMDSLETSPTSLISPKEASLETEALSTSPTSVISQLSQRRPSKTKSGDSKSKSRKRKEKKEIDPAFASLLTSLGSKSNSDKNISK